MHVYKRFNWRSLIGVLGMIAVSSCATTPALPSATAVSIAGTPCAIVTKPFVNEKKEIDFHSYGKCCKDHGGAVGWFCN